MPEHATRAHLLFQRCLDALALAEQQLQLRRALAAREQRLAIVPQLLQSGVSGGAAEPSCRPVAQGLSHRRGRRCLVVLEVKLQCRHRAPGR